MLELELDNHSHVKIGIYFLFLLISLVLAATFLHHEEMSQGQCYQKTNSCTGITSNNQCIGLEQSSREFTQNCETESIEKRCNEAGEHICDSNQEEIGDSWKEHATVEGISCNKWDENYELNLKTC